MCRGRLAGSKTPYAVSDGRRDLAKSRRGQITVRSSNTGRQVGPGPASPGSGGRSGIIDRGVGSRACHVSAAVG